MVIGDCGYCSHQGKIKIFKCAGSVKRPWNYLYHYRLDGNCIYGFYGNIPVVFILEFPILFKKDLSNNLFQDINCPD